jgi:endonuclease/exonuclease/phosphatase family metal-dependent hydrolase
MGIRFVGVCIPWHDAHVSTGRKDKSQWQDHLDYLRELHLVILRYLQAPEPLCLLGDFNQRIPQIGQPDEVYAGLQLILGLGLRAMTTGLLDDDRKMLIDHIAIGPGLAGKFRDFIPKKENGLTLSDHTGVVVELEA